MTDETTTEQLVEIEEQATEYLPPEGWQEVPLGEPLKGGDEYHAGLDRYIRRIEPQPQPEPEPQTEPVQVREGRWRTRNGEIKDIRPCDPLEGPYFVWPWTDGVRTFQDNGRHRGSKDSANDLVEYLGPIEQQPQTQSQPPMLQDADERIRLLKQANAAQAETIERLQIEARDLNMEIGGLERQLLQRDARIRDLETMHAAAAQTVVDAGKQNDALRVQNKILQQEANKKNSRIEFLETLNAGNGAAIDDYRAKVAKLQSLVDTARGQLETAATEHDSLSTQLAAVKAELVTQAETSRRLQIELDAAQQVPADSPELRQLRADLAEVTRERDQYLDSYQRIFGDLETIRETTKAAAVEAIAEWLEPIRLVDSAYLANETLQHLPQIMRHLTGLDSHAID